MPLARSKDAEFIAHAREDIPALLHDLRLSQERVRELEAELVEVDSMDEYEASREAAINEALRKDASALMRTCLGQEMYSRLWGPELERLGAGVDAALKARNDAISRADLAERRVKELEASSEMAQRIAEEALRFDSVKDEWSEAIAKAHPVRSESHEQWGTAMKMVGNRHGKGELVALVNWLLVNLRFVEMWKQVAALTARAEAAEANLAEAVRLMTVGPAPTQEVWQFIERVRFPPVPFSPTAQSEATCARCHGFVVNLSQCPDCKGTGKAVAR